MHFVQINGIIGAKATVGKDWKPDFRLAFCVRVVGVDIPTGFFAIVNVMDV
jgi:hypothetical protein